MSDTLGAAIIGAAAAIAGVALTIAGGLTTEATRMRRERAARLHDVRQHAYSQFLAHVRLLLDWVKEMRDYPDLAPEECDDSLDADQWRKEAARMTSEINLIGSEEVAHDTYALQAAAFAWFAYREHWQESHGPYEEGLADGVTLDDLADDGKDGLDSDDDDPDLDFVGERTFRLLLESVAKDCVKSMRNDLGAPPAKDLPAYDFS